MDDSTRLRIAKPEPDRSELRVIWSKLTELSEIAIRRCVPVVGGIYVLWQPPMGQSAMKPYYVGSAVDLQRRLLDHLSGGYRTTLLGPLEEGDVQFQYASLEPFETRRRVATYLFNALRPEGNQRAPGGVPQSVNLPVP
jgi:hypothetical protein